MRIRVRVGDAVAEGTLFDDKAPKTIQTRWSGDAWRTEGNYELLPESEPVENVAERLSAGDIIYYPGYRSKLIKVGIAYGSAQWLAPFMVPIDVAHIGKLDTNLDAFVEQCSKIIFEGPFDVEISRIES